MYPPLYPPPNPSIAAPPFRYPTMISGIMPRPMHIPMTRPPMPTPQPMASVRPRMANTSTVVAPPMLNKPSDANSMVTTVFVGNIHDRAPDAMVKSMLQKCGNVLSWKRVQGASGKPKAFGFCEFEDPSSSIRCIHLLNDFNIIDKKLLVKADLKNQERLDEYKKKKEKQKTEKEEGEDDDDDEKDDEVRGQLEITLKEYEEELHKVEDDDPHNKVSKEETTLNLEGMELEDDIKYLVNREIRSFRDTHLNSERDKDKDVRDSRRKDEHRERERDRERDRERKERDHEKRRSPRERQVQISREVKRSREVIDLDDDADDDYERKRLERKIREKEASYQEMVRKWEERECRKNAEYERDRKKEKDRRRKEEKEASKMRTFFEDYEDRNDDASYFRGSVLQRRLHEREKELEADERDRRREREELEEIRKKLQEQGHPDLESEMARIELMREEHLMPQMSNYQSDSPVIILEQDNDVSQSTIDITMDTELIDPVQTDSSPKLLHGYPTSPPEIESPNSPVNNSMQGAADFRSPQLSTNNIPGIMNFQLIKVDAKAPPKSSPTSESNKRKLELAAVFNQDDDEEENSLAAKMRRFKPIGMNGFNPDSTEKGSSSPTPITAEGKREWIKNFIEKIPATRQELFAWTVSWNMVDQELVNKRIKPWINKKIIEYIGEEEPTLTDFISTKILSHASPDTILAEVSVILDEESEEFVMKLWRLLIYEVEAKRRGISR